jgi:hypothetical protein
MSRIALHPNPFALPFGAMYHWIATGAGGVVRAVARRRALTALAHLDDRLLKDVGLTRSTLQDAVSDPRDPTSLLAGRGKRVPYY